MRVIAANDYLQMSQMAARFLSAQVTLKPDSVLGLATGSSPIGLYKELTALYSRGDLDFSQVRTINLDEYKGLTPDHPQSYRYFMNQHLLTKVNIDLSNTFMPDGLEQDEDKACRDYDRVNETIGPIDVQLLGLGHNGHIGFNEPSDGFSTGTHCVLLDERTLEANARFFDNDIGKVPTKAYTMGVRSILHSKRILLIVSGADKADILCEAMTGPITPQVPGSILQLHDDVTVIADVAALRCLQQK